MAQEVRKVSVAEVRLWGQVVGACAWDHDRGHGRFEYDPAFVRRGLEIAPLMLPLHSGVFSFPALNRTTFYGLPGLLADTLPDRFGNRIIDLAGNKQHAGVIDPPSRIGPRRIVATDDEKARDLAAELGQQALVTGLLVGLVHRIETGD